jgi:hypothetical protein
MENKPKKSKKKVAINISNCKYEVIRSVAASHSFEIIDDVNSTSDWQLYWIDTGVSLDRILELSVDIHLRA